MIYKFIFWVSDNFSAILWSLYTSVYCTKKRPGLVKLISPNQPQLFEISQLSRQVYRPFSIQPLLRISTQRKYEVRNFCCCFKQFLINAYAEFSNGFDPNAAAVGSKLALHHVPLVFHRRCLCKPNGGERGQIKLWPC